MIKEIVKNIEFLQQKSVNSIIREDKQIYQDLLDTANAYKESCAGLAAIQIGYTKRAIVVLIDNNFYVFVNPIIVSKSPEMYETVEGCLSLDGVRTTKRHKTIFLLYTTINGKTRKQKFTGIVAQIIQHEVDHCNGILI